MIAYSKNINRFSCEHCLNDSQLHGCSSSPHDVKHLSSLYSKHFADETYNAHRVVDDVVAIEWLFTSTPLVSLLSTLTIWNMQKLIQEWNNKVQKNNRIQQLVKVLSRTLPSQWPKDWSYWGSDMTI